MEYGSESGGVWNMALRVEVCGIWLWLWRCVEYGGTIPKTNEIVTNICSCHNFFPLSSVQIIIIPACCLLCVL